MGAYFSKSKKTDPNDYEKILSELDGQIQKTELKLSDLKIRERRWTLLWILYSSVIWLVYALYSFMMVRGSDLTMDIILFHITPVVVAPVCIYYVRQLAKWLFVKRQSYIESKLSTLRREQKLKVEELKKKTAYYTTKSLLDRYEGGQRGKQAQPKEGVRQRKSQQQAQQQHQQQPMAGAARHPQGGVAAKMGGNPPLASSSFPSSPSSNPSLLHSHPDQQQQQQQQQQQNAGVAPLMTRPAYLQPQPPHERHWYDRVVDALVGEEGPESKFALVCQFCMAHNGLVLPTEIDTIQYVCPVCKKFNPSRQSRQLHPNGPVIPPASPLPGSRPTSVVLPDQEDKEEQEEEEEDNKGDEYDEDEEEEEEENGKTVPEPERGKESEQSKEEHTSIGARVRRRHKTSTDSGGRKPRNH
ncbi:hypothetical protein BCR43DRAFT_485056 [Syncephalastrum racemosum]|uniref:Endoplasmic reticulum junction formation protein lunapark n=1 Tax=Syncephalastrum racemosum TaxID=13706 RepID=A0A1X2HLT0_SYNRA|nr:hypothetical protein BCR43DRAFT_485056 [Syncephalastrum racemosum]